MLITNIPFPPSTNELYETNVNKFLDRSGKMRFKTSRRCSAVLSVFKKNCEQFKLINSQKIEQISKEVKQILADGYVIKMDAYVALSRERLFTKEGKPKQFDADNRRKALQDCICDMLGIDDKYVFAGNMEKVLTSNDREYAFVKITAAKVNSAKDIEARL